MIYLDMPVKNSISSLDTSSFATSSSSTFRYNSDSGVSVQYKWLRSRDYNESASTNYSSFKLSSSTSEFHSQKLSPEVEIKAKKASASIVSLVQKDEYVAGETSKTELFLEKLYYENKIVFREAFQKAWLELFKGDDESFATFLSIASAIEYSWLGDRADALAISGCSHTNPFVNEAAIRAIEAWSNPQHAGYLEKIKPFDIAWLEKYRQSVAGYLASLL